MPPTRSNSRITTLPAETSSLLRSTVIIPSLPSILTELVQNSLDAGATAINVAVDLARWSIKVEDNGRGIADISLLAQRYCTSKLVNQQVEQSYGFRGEALASMADIASLEILTRSGSSAPVAQGTHTLLIRGGVELALGLSKVHRTAPGTTVWVRDIFYKVSVRVVSSN